MTLDIRTLVFVLGLTHVIQLAAFIHQYRVNRTLRGVGWWLLWSGVEVLAFAFMLLRGLPALQATAIVAQNGLLILGVMFFYIGILRFYDRKENRRLLLAIYAAYLAGLCYFLFGRDDFGARGAIISVTLALFAFLSVRALLLNQTRATAAAANLLAAVCIVHGCHFAFRFAVQLAAPPPADFFAPTWFNWTALVDAIVVGLLWTIGTILMINQRLNAEMKEAKEEMELVFNISPDAAVISRLSDGLIVHVNDGFEVLSGLRREACIGRTTLAVQAWKNPADREAVVRILREKGCCRSHEVVFQRKDGSELSGLVSAAVFTLHDMPHVISVTRDITERKQAEAALEESRRLFAQAEELGKVGGWEFDIVTRQSTWTKAVYDIHEVDGAARQTVDQGINFYTPASRPIIERAVQRAIEQGEPFDLELEIITAKGNRRSVHTVGRADLARGQISGFLQDITDRKRLENELNHHLGLAEESRRALLGILEEQKRAEAALRTSEQRYRRLVANTETGLVVIDDKGTVISADDPYLRLTGAREIADVVGHSVMEWTAPDEKESNARAVALCAGRGFIQDFETIYQHADGTRTDVSINATVEATPDGGIRIASLCRNITERKRAERAVEESKQLVESVVENVPLMIFLKEATDLRFVVFNRAGEELLGYDRNALLGKNTLDLFPPEQAAHLMAKDREALAGPGVVDIPEEAIMTVKRGERLLHTRKVCIRGVDGGTKYLLGISEDITERKRAEAEKEKLQAQFAQAQKMDSVGRLAGGVAHDFNNLLMGIMGYVDLCRDTVAPDHPMREWLDEIMHDAQRSAEITRQLLAFARKQVIAPRVLDLNDAVAGMLTLLRRLIGEDVHLAWRPGAALKPVELDPSQVDQILANLCVNARDAIAGVGEIILGTANATVEAGDGAEPPESIPGAYVVLAVSDNGCGMDKKTQAQIFEPFFTTKGLGKGTGLGLATVYGIVKQNRGFINVYSEPGKGTTFKVHLPAVAAEADVCVTTKVEMPRGRGEIILLAEDEKSLRVTCGLFLKALGYEVLLAASPVEALQMADQYPGDIHVLLTDVVMPGMDGRQLAQRISAVKAGVKVVFMSGYTADVIAQRGVLDEGLQFLSKPFTRDDLARKVREVLEAG